MARTGQNWDAGQYRAHAAFVPALGEGALRLLAPQAGERILDLGCGDGALTERLAACGCQVLGVDASQDMVQAARARGLEAMCLDAHELNFNAQFDAVFSNAALHWMRQPARVLSGVYRALKPGGRFVAEFGGHGNVATITSELDRACRARGIRVASPWYFPRPEDYRQLLETHGFEVSLLEYFDRPTLLPGELGAWLETFAQTWTAALPQAERAAFIDEVTAALHPELCDQQGQWRVDYIRLRFAATKA